MAARVRSPFGLILRDERRAEGLSQAELATRIADRFASDPDVAAYGVISDRAIANIEAAKNTPAEFVRPRPETVTVLMLALGISPDSERGEAMLRAARDTRRREVSVPASSDSMIDIPFVRGGREEIWAQLEKSREIALSGQPRIQLIAGTAGVGKSRLIEEFTTHLSGAGPNYILAYGECSSGAAMVDPYLPWRRALSSILRRDLRLGGPPPNARVYANVLLASVPTLGEVVIDLHDLEEWLSAAFADLLPEFERLRDTVSPTNTIGRYDQLVHLIVEVTRHRPLVIVLEDLHWADESSCSLLLYLQRQMRLHTDMPLMLIGTYRPSDLVVPGGRHPLQHVINEIGLKISSAVLNLESTVGNEQGRQFVTGVVDVFPMSESNRSALINLLYGRTQGHPLFTTELVRRLVETGGLAPQPDHTWTLDADHIDIQLPKRMRAVIDERLQRLSENARTLVEAASVHGGPFSAAALPSLPGVDSAEVSLILDRELVEKHRIFNFVTDDIGEEYEFSHQVMAETVYESLSPARRAALHRQTAEAIISRNTNDPLVAAPKAAHHYEQAGMYAEAAEQALLTSFATLARLDHDLTLVWVDHSERLAVMANDTSRLWNARLRRAHVLRSMGSLQEARSIGVEGVQQAQRLGDVDMEADGCEVVALVAYDRGLLDDAIDNWNRAIHLYEILNRQDRVSAGHSMLSHVACRLGQLDDAIRHARAGWAAAPDPLNDGLGAEALLAEGNALMELGRYQDAIDVFTRSLQSYSRTGEMRGILLCRMNIGLCQVRMGNTDNGIMILEELLQEMEPLRTPRLLAFTYRYLAIAQEKVGDFAAAEKLYELALDTRRESGLDAMAGDDLAGIVRCSIQLGRDVSDNLARLQRWWRNNDPRALEDPLLAMLTLYDAYACLGNAALMEITLSEAHASFEDRAAQIQNPAMRTTYIQNSEVGQRLLAAIKAAGPI